MQKHKYFLYIKKACEYKKITINNSFDNVEEMIDMINEKNFDLNVMAIFVGISVVVRHEPNYIRIRSSKLEKELRDKLNKKLIKYKVISKFGSLMLVYR